VTTTLASPARRALPAAAWPVIAVVLTAAIAAGRLLATPAFYFADDTQIGAFGQWWELGDRLLSGGIPVLAPQAWQAGNYFAEGQWGLLNPLTWLIALGARASEDPAAFSAVVKIAFLALMALGVHLLARGFGASAPWAALAGVLVPLAGFTVYMDAPSWATGLFNAAVLPWVWWSLRRVVESDRAIWPYLISSYVLITFGYVFGVMVLVVILVESLVRALLAKDWARVLRTVLASAWGALLTVVVYLPGVLTAPVTERAGFDILNTGFLNADLSDLASAAAPLATATVGSWWGTVTAAPLVYVAWILPLFPLVLPMARDAVKRCVPLLVLGLITLVVVIGPSQVGPIRWPVRFMPYLVLAVVVLFAVAAARAYPSRVTRRGILWSAVVLVVTTGITYANTAPTWRSIALVALMQAGFLVGVGMLALAQRSRPSARTRTGVAVAGAMAVSALIVVPQLAAFPATPLPKFGVPDSVSRMAEVLDGVEGDAILVGDLYADGERPESFDERLMANLWYLSPASVSSLYTVLPYSAFSKDLCLDLKGATCADALPTLWSEDPETGLAVVDLMGVSAIVAMKATFPEEPVAPDGWSGQDAGAFTWLLTRDDPVPAAGGVVWSGEGTRVSVLEQTETSVRLEVDEVGADGRVTLGRLDYPGYSIQGAQKVDPVRGWLLTVDVSSASPGGTVVVSFLPPGIWLMVAAAALSAVLVVAWPLLRRRARRRAPAISADSPARSAAPGKRG
jgi:hypothetical protein